MRALFLVTIGLAAAAPAAKGDHPPSMLGAADLDPARVLPPPPAKGSAQAVADMAELHATEATRTPTETDAAKSEGEIKSAAIFAGVLGPRFDLARLPATAALMGIVRETGKAVVDRGKDEFRRERPYVIDPALKSCKRNEDPLSSYPSGHATMAFSMAATLARLVPAQAQPLLARAAAYGQTRITCEQHFRSDVTAGEALGLVIAERLMTKPGFRAAFAAAQAELAAAGIAR